MKSFRIVFAGGGSGGHIYPLIAVAEASQKLWQDTGARAPLELYYVGPRDEYAAMLESHGIAVRSIVAGKLRRYFSLQNFLDVPKFFIGFVQALWRLYWLMPDVIFSKGGSGALPVVIAGWWYRIPIAIHESDALPGLSNLQSARFAKKICVSFEGAAAYFDPKKTVVTGTPVRADLLENRTTQEAAKDALGFSSSHPLLFIVGGSQGSRPLNLFVVENLKPITQMAQVLHQTGMANFAEAEKLSQAALMNAGYGNRYRAISYLDDQTLRLALTAADVVLSRAGSGIFELAAFGKPMILVPHPSAGSNDHQSANAQAFAANGGAVVIEETNLFGGIFITEFKRILDHADVREAMGRAAMSHVVPNAAERIAEEVLKMGA
jgi:UDP-N-acetylglucosamine--N-acetylmuramyl-(pentapeptide) pyrophosphoryl-undecaprenol N-acetylglucosamine transferase